MPLPFSIFICTRNRSSLIQENLESLSNCIGFSEIDIFVVDNASTDNTRDTLQEWTRRHSNIHSLYEEKIGIAHARNRSVLECKTEWIIMLDDDAIVPNNFIVQIVQTKLSSTFDIIGGFFLPWYKYGKPIWYDDSWASNVIPLFSTGPAPSGVYACAGVMAFKRCIWDDVGGFRTDLGHIGKKRLYGEETELQLKAIQKGYKLGLDTHWTISHLVPREKMSLVWLFQYGLKLGQANTQLFKNRPPHRHFMSWLSSIRTHLFRTDSSHLPLKWHIVKKIGHILVSTGYFVGSILQKHAPRFL